MYHNIFLGKIVSSQQYPEIGSYGETWNDYTSWPAHVRKNLKELLDLVSDDESGHNAQRLFWKWLDKQRWRKMMPLPFENFAWELKGFFGN